MFDKEYSFRGKHAQKVIALTSNLDDSVKGGIKLFDRNLDVYIDAPLVGFLYGQKSELDNTKDPDKNEVITAKVFGDILMKYKLELEFNFRLIMLLDSNYESNKQARINKAFRKMGEQVSDIELYESYVRGGVDILYSKLIEGASNTHDYINNLNEFIEEFHERFNTNINLEDILDKCRLIE